MDFSFSSLSKYAQCPAAFEIYKIRGLEKRYANYKLLLGQLVHKSIEARIQGNDPFAIMRQYCNDFATQYLHEAELVEETYEHAVKLFEHMVKGLDTWKFIAVEKEILIDLEDGGNRIIGYIDAIIETREGEKFILDWKTRGKFKTSDEEQYNMQMAIYQEALAREGEVIDGIMIVQIATTGKPKVEVLTMYRNRATVQRMFEQVRWLAQSAWADMTTSKHFEKRGLLSGACLYCDFKLICRSEVDGYELDTAELFQLKQKGR